MNSAPSSAAATASAASPMDVRTPTADEWDDWYDVLMSAFGGSPDAPEERALWRELTELPRALGVFDGKAPVATAGAFSFQLAVPGGAMVPAAGVTMVGVLGTHRRRGLLGALMRRQLDHVRELGEPVAVLTASEPAIYGRFGYGIATSKVKVTAPRHRVRVRGDLGRELRLRLADPVESLTACEALYAEVGAHRPGWLARPAGWERQAVLDPEQDRGGASALRCVLAEDPESGELLGYARYAVLSSWQFNGPEGTVRVRELCAREPRAEAALWRHLLDVDLTDTVTAFVPADSALLHLVDDPRRLAAGFRDDLHVRLVDVPAALGGRTYARPVDVVLAVEDAFCPWNAGTWRLRGDESGAECVRLPEDVRPELTLGVAELGAAYLGGTSLSALASAGRVREHRPDAGALRTTAAAFASDLAPWLPRGF